jgi:hypothetical protein
MVVVVLVVLIVADVDVLLVEDVVVLTWSNAGWEGLSAPVIQETVARLPCLLQPPPSWRLLHDGFPEKVFVLGPSVTE